MEATETAACRKIRGPMAHYKDGGGRESRKRARDDYDGNYTSCISQLYYYITLLPLFSDPN